MYFLKSNEMKRTVTLQILCLILLSGSQRAESTALRCPLIWAPYGFDKVLPEAALNSNPLDANPSGHFILRAHELNSSVVHIGRFNNLTTDGYIVIGKSSIRKLHGIEIARNDWECTLTWRRYSQYSDEGFRAEDHSLLVPSYANATKFVGAVYDDESRDFVSGEVSQVSSSRYQITYASGTGTSPRARNSSDFYYLTSYSSGLRVQFINVTFASPFEEVYDLLATDEISNDSPATVSQTLTHTKVVTTSAGIEHTTQWEEAGHIEFGAGISLDLFGLLSLGFDFSASSSYAFSSSTSNIYGREERVEIGTARKIVVPPFSSVQVCSFYGKVRRFEGVAWTAVGSYTVKGWTGQEVCDYLSSRPSPPSNLKCYTDQLYATSTESGKFSGEFVFSTVLYVVPASASTNCTSVIEVMGQLESLRSQRISGSGGIGTMTSEEAELQQEIDRFFQARPPPRRSP